MFRNMVALEGPDGSGKANLAGAIAGSLEKCGCESVVVSVPCSTDVRESGRKYSTADPYRSVRLFFARFTMAAENRILPALAEGKSVILNCSILSLLAWQYYRFPPAERDERVFALGREEWNKVRHIYNLNPLHLALELDREEWNRRLRSRTDITVKKEDASSLFDGFEEALEQELNHPFNFVFDPHDDGTIYRPVLHSVPEILFDDGVVRRGIADGPLEQALSAIRKAGL